MSPSSRLIALRVGLVAIVILMATLVVLGIDRVRLLMENTRVADGDRLNFYAALLGAVVGAILAIGGALLIEEVRIYMAGRGDRKLIREALAELKAVLEPIADDPIGREDPALWSKIATEVALGGALPIVRDVTTLLASAPLQAKLDSFRQVSAINRVVENGRAVERAIGAVVQGATEGEAALPVQMEAAVRPAVERLLQNVDVALRALRG
jgi:hypothetical protein